jgi:hypothetical protein
VAEERDVYRLDADQAQQVFKQLADLSKQFGQALTQQAEASKHSAEAVSELTEGIGGKLQGAIVVGQAAFSLLSSAAREAFTLLKDGVKDAASEEASVLRLSGAVRGLGYNVKEVVPVLSAQAEALEHSLFVESEQVRQVQSMLLQFGVAPGVVNKATEAIVKYAVATGKDATTAAQSLLTAMESGREGLRRFGVVIKDTHDFTQNLSQASDKLIKQFGGAAVEATRGFSGEMKALEVAQKDLTKALGNFLINSDLGHSVINKLTQAVQGMTHALSDEHAHDERVIKNTEAHTQAVNDLIAARKFLKELEEGERERPNRTAELQIENAKKGIALILERIRVTAEAMKADSEATLAEIDHAKKLDEIAESKETAELRRTKNALMNADDVRKAEEQHLERQRKLAEAFKKVEEANVKAARSFLSEAMLDYQAEKWFKTLSNTDDFEKQRSRISVTTAKTTAAELLRVQKSYNAGTYQLAMERRHFLMTIEDELVADWKQAEEGLAQFIGQQLTKMATTNQAYAEAYQKASLERRQADLQEQGIIVDTAQLKKEAADEEAAATQQMVANAIASIAQQAAVKAVFETAEGLAALGLAALGFAPGAVSAGQHFAAAAAYGSIAGVGFIASSVLSNNRGFTSEERSSLENLRSKKKDGKDDTSSTGPETGSSGATSKAAGTNAADVGPGATVNVYYLGITGLTVEQQGKELERIRRQYSNLKTGSAA